MKSVMRITMALLCLLGAVTAVGQTASVDWVRGTDFSRFHTFTWATGAYPIQDPDPNLRMAFAIQDELAAKGVTYVMGQQKFDVFVAYTAIVNPDPQSVSRNIVTLKVMIFDSRNNTIIWRAGGYFELGKDKQQNRANAKALLVSMFNKYPPTE